MFQANMIMVINNLVKNYENISNKKTIITIININNDKKKMV